MIDPKAFGEELASIVKAATLPIVARLDQLEKRFDSLPVPQDGKDADEDAIASNVKQALSAELDSIRDSIAKIPSPEIPDVAGLIETAMKSVEDQREQDAAQVQALSAELDSIRDSIAEIPSPEIPDVAAMISDAMQSADEQRDQDAAQVQALMDSYQKTLDALSAKIADLPQPKELDPEELRSMVKDEVSEAVAAIPAPQDGKSVTVEDVAPLIDEAVSKAVAAIPVPKDGCGIKNLLIDRDGELVATMDDGRVANLGPVVGKDADMASLEHYIDEKIAALPKPKDGKDGFSLKDFDAALMDDGRTVLLSFEQGDQSYKVELGFPVMIYRGVFKQGETYAKGDTVTWGGSLWHCDVDQTEDKPDGMNKDWTLAAKRGRDGKDVK